MGQEHKTHEEILKEIDDAKTKISVGAIYVHYKNPDKKYKVSGFGTLESTDELCVIYQTEYVKKLTFIRPVKEWLETVERQGKTVQRFTKSKKS